MNGHLAAWALVLFASVGWPRHVGAQGPAFQVTDGTAQPVILSSDLPDFRTVGTTTFFVASTPATGTELWKTDGTAGAALVKDVNPGSAGSNPVPLADVDGVLLFLADDGTHGVELWRTDGTEAGTALVKDINPGDATSNPTAPTEGNGVLFFIADDGAHGSELWRSDGTEDGTVVASEIPGGSPPSFLTSVNGMAFFVADDGVHGPKLWRSDDGSAQPVLLNPDSTSVRFFALAALNDTLIFQVQADYGVELWRSDGTVAGTVFLMNVTKPETLVASGGTAFLVGADPDHCNEQTLWKTDGTIGGTRLLKNVEPCSRFNLMNLTDVDGTLFFTVEPADNLSPRMELWKSDGTEAGTVQVRDLYPDANYSANVSFLAVIDDGTLLFRSHNYLPADPRSELWSSDGTTAGTVLLKPDILPEQWIDAQFAAVGGTMFFAGYDGASGWELWKTDGTVAGTVLVKDIDPGPDGSNPTALTNVNGRLVFQACDPQSGCEVWTSDGTADGTRQLADVEPGGGSSSLSGFTVAGSFIYATTEESSHDGELWAIPLSALDQSPPCTGDCNGDGTVAIDDLVLGVNIALGVQPVSACPAFASSEGVVDIAQLIQGVNNALNGCGGAGVWYVDDGAPAGGDGRSWASALRFVADALAAARAGDTIHVAQGTYQPDRSAASPDGSGDRSATFQLRNRVELRGGYAGLGAADPDAIDLALHPSTLSGDLAGDDGVDFENDGENSLHVVTGSGVDGTALIDGFTISGGNANGAAAYPDADQIGGGMLNWGNGSPTVVHCTFEGNSAQYAGGGMANGFGSSPKISDCTFTGNVTAETLDSGGGGMVNVAESSPEITRCTFTQNRAPFGAGILNSLGASPTVVGCTFEGNVASIYNGGAMYSIEQALPYVRDCVFRGNVAAHVGGALSFRNTPSDVWIINSLFDGNTAADGGGGVRAGNSSSVHVVNCTFVGNSANGSNPSFPGRAGGLDVGSDSNVALRTTTIENSVFWDNTGGGQPRQLALQGFFPAELVVGYSDVQGGEAGVFVQGATFPLTWGEGNIDADPLFVAAAAYDFRLAADSPCIGRGDPGAVPPDVTTDLAGNPRLADGGGSVDMGPYQFAGSR